MPHTSLRSNEQIKQLEMQMFSAIAGHPPTIGPPVEPPRTRFGAAGEWLVRWCACQMPHVHSSTIKKLVEAKERILRRTMH
jgi:hypothetical protein